ncbi:hypothetical protein EON66_04140 [archaeon]|nr:MAG: hypothetical protein EON66_04140 [archaeon]
MLLWRDLALALCASLVCAGRLGRGPFLLLSLSANAHAARLLNLCVHIPPVARRRSQFLLRVGGETAGEHTLHTGSIAALLPSNPAMACAVDSACTP